MTMKDYEFNAANEFNEMLKKAETDIDRESLRDITFKGICIHCGAVINDDRCYCLRDD